MSNQKQPGSRSRSSIGLYGELARAIDADRQREAEDYRLIRQARDARAGRDRAARPALVAPASTELRTGDAGGTMSRSLSNASGGYRSARQASARTDAPPCGEPSPSQSRRATKRLSEKQVTELVLAAAAGNQAAWYGLVDEFNRMIWAVARAHRLSDADAGDVVQVTWLRLLESLDRLHNPARVGGWLATTARRECLRVLNANRRQVPIGDDVVEQESLAPLPGESLARVERNEAVRQAFSLLRERDQALLRLLTAEPSLRYAEISAALGMPVGSIGPSRQRALERLRRELESQRAMTLLAE